jgi:hypothetical protein
LDYGAANQFGLEEGFSIYSKYEFRNKIDGFDDIAKK